MGGTIGSRVRANTLGGGSFVARKRVEGFFSVYRFSLALCLFSATMILFTCRTTRIGAKVHRGFWFLKFVYIIALLVCMLFVDNQTLVGYREVSRYLSVPFLIIQIVLLIDSAYRYNERCLAYDTEESRCGTIALSVSSFLLYAFSIGGWVFMILRFGHDGCSVSQTLISMTILLTLGMSIVSCTKIAPHGTIFTSGVVTSYCTYLCYSYLTSYPNGLCNPSAVTHAHNSIDLLVGLLLGAVSMASMAWNATGSKEVLLGEPLVETETETRKEDAPESWWYFHLMMGACALYMSMLLTDWSALPPGYDTPASLVDYNVGWGSFGAKLASQLLCILLYGWTLFAPYLLRNYRDYGIEFPS